MGEIISFSDKKTSMDHDRSHHFVSLDLFMNSDNCGLWAKVDNIGEVDIDPEWHRFIASQLRALAWMADGMAAEAEGTQTNPIASITVFEDSRISTRWNAGLVNTKAQVDWIEEQIVDGIKEIDPSLKG
jgi:hypothetical protein